MGRHDGYAKRVDAGPRLSFLLTVLLMAVFALACASPPPEEPWKSYDFSGTVVQLQPTDQIAIIEHEAIGDWMGAMKMGFPVRDSAEFAKLTEGAKIKATIQTQAYESYYLEDIEVLPE